MGFIEMALEQIEARLAATQSSVAAIQQPYPADGRLVRSVDSTAYEALLADLARTLTDAQVLIEEVRHLKAMVPPYRPARPVTVAEAIEAMHQIASAGTTTMADYLAYQQRARSK